jgi:hypothetical protein
MLLPEVEVLYTMTSLRRLEAISLHPILRLHVRSLVYTTDRLPIYPDDCSTQWKAEAKAQEHSRRIARAREIVGPESVGNYLAELPQPPWSEIVGRKRWEAYREMRDEQQVNLLLSLSPHAQEVLSYSPSRRLPANMWTGTTLSGVWFDFLA